MYVAHIHIRQRTDSHIMHAQGWKGGGLSGVAWCVATDKEDETSADKMPFSRRQGKKERKKDKWGPRGLHTHSAFITTYYSELKLLLSTCDAAKGWRCTIKPVLGIISCHRHLIARWGPSDLNPIQKGLVLIFATHTYMVHPLFEAQLCAKCSSSTAYVRRIILGRGLHLLRLICALLLCQ